MGAPQNGRALRSQGAGSVGRLAMRRRSFVEQRVVRMIRGEEEREAAVHSTQFARLRGLASKNGLVIHSPGRPYLAADELRLLAWLAQAQRVLGYTRPFHPDALLTLTVVHCAGTLDALGIRLPSLAFCHASRDAVVEGSSLDEQ